MSISEDFLHRKPLMDKVMVNKSPFPYLFADHVIGDDIIEKMLTHWPTGEEQTPEGYNEGVYIHHVGMDGAYNFFPNMSLDRREFWNGCTEDVLKPIVEDALSRLLPSLDWVRLQDLANHPDIRIQHLMLMESRRGYRPHPAHTHFCHSPHWLMTLLIYLDDASESDRGTRIVEFLPSRQSADDLATVCARIDEHFYLTPDPLQHAGNVRLHEVPFSRGSVLAFLETPDAVHAGPPLERAARTGARRRLVRMHISAHPEMVQRSFGVPHADFSSLAKDPAAQSGAVYEIYRRVMERPGLDGNGPSHLSVGVDFSQQGLNGIVHIEDPIQ
ncbi:hypothetical protein [Azospirillum griseum]|uniref:Phytanoyl-CoA dioxygenase (PhyH) n=1 Tax=Azospirillum griseum TaxID=2496639 RepID=A0A3S0HWL5_9PROT|nr:hypothetical protein [Azospirillum griseum]RTR11449.1 hypothetical protein EJ903_26090 [Azospirillum griseum]